MIKSSKSYTRIAISVPREQATWFKKHKFRVLGPSAFKDENGHAKVDMVIDYSEDDDSEDEDDEDDEEEILVEDNYDDEIESEQVSEKKAAISASS
jgi:hypothetical protein